MALSDVEIWMELQAKALIIDPLPDVTSISAASVDLHLDKMVHVYKDIPDGMKVDLGDAKTAQMIAYCTEVVDITKQEICLMRDNFVIGFTHENIVLPTHLLARVEGRSSIARLGISVHNEAPTIQPGFDGQIALELTNVGPLVVRLTEGIAICQLVIERLGRPAVKPYQEQFQGQKAPQQ